MNGESLIKSWDNFSIDFTHIFEVDGVHHTSTIDHFFWNEKLSNSIVEADVLHLPDNTSDHCPIYCQINIENLFPTELSTTLGNQNLVGKKLTLNKRKITRECYNRV